MKAIAEGMVKSPPPELIDILWSLAIDSNVLDYASFEDWVRDNGGNPDSRTDEKCYQDCLKHALTLRVMLGNDGLKKLQTAGEDY